MRFDEDLPALLDRAADAGLTDIIMPSIDLIHAPPCSACTMTGFGFIRWLDSSV